jgi:2,3-bisphosphoglycerate-dependent phosphoglycerate mutase
MTTGLQLGSITDEIGTSDFFYAFFSTISGNLEPLGWGSRFPVLMKKLYGGEVSQTEAKQALAELAEIKSEFADLKPDKVIWDFSDPEKHAPWGNNISSEITDLSNYFVTSTGRDFVGILKEILEELQDRGGVVKVVTV